MNNDQIPKEMVNYVPRLSLKERDRRWENVRIKMVLNGLDCLLLYGNDIFWDMGMVNFRYLTQIGAKHGGMAVFPVEGDPVIFSAPPHMNKPYSPYLTSQEWVHDIRPFTGVPDVIDCIKGMGFENSKIGIVGYGSKLARSSVPHMDYIEVEKLLPNAVISDETPMITELRLIKSAEEIGMLEKAGKIARKAIDALIETARPGVKECEVFAEMVRAQIANGAEAQIFLLLTSGSIEDARPNLLHGKDQPFAPTARELKEGDIVICEFHTCYGGYMSGTEFTVCLGKAPSKYKRLHDVSIECLKAETAAMRPGVSLKEVLKATFEPLERSGLDLLELGFHGHGMASPEFPVVVSKSKTDQLPLYRIGDFRLREGMVFGQNCDLFDPQWKPGVGHMLGSTVVIEAEGARRIVDIPEELPQLE